MLHELGGAKFNIAMANHPFNSGAVKCLVWLCIFNSMFKICKSLEDGLESFRHIQIADSNTIETLKNSRTLSVIYYYTKGEFPGRGRFLQAFDNSAKYLEAYTIALAVVNCAANAKIDGECREENAGRNVVTYQNGVELIKLELDTMFDINSIMSNSLQLLLLREVPIVENQSDRESLQTSLIGHHDLIYFYTRAIGTLEHRVFMEIAYTYQDSYKFAISTKLDLSTGLQDSESLPSSTKYALWTLYCSKPSEEDIKMGTCPSVLFRGSLTLSTLADYMKRLPEPNLFYAPENGTSLLFEMENDLPIIFIYTNNKMKEHSDDVSQSLAHDVKGFAKIIVVNIDDKECHLVATEQGFDGHIPQVAVAIPDGNLNFMEKRDKLNLSDIHHFLRTAVTIPTKPGEEVVNSTDPSENRGDGDDLIRGVEVQDDEVAKAVFRNEVDKLEITHLPAVLKGTFQDVVQSAQLKMVLYYLPYDAVSLAFLPDFEMAAKILSSIPTTQDILARVNCFDASDLCAKENITTYPVVRIHKKDLPYQAYEGALDTESVIKAVGLLRLDFPQILENEDEVNRFISGNFPTKTTDLSPSSVMFVAKKEDKEAWAVFRAASRRLSTFVAMAEVHESLVDLIAGKYQSSVPCVVSIHHSDAVQPVRTLSSIADSDGVVSFVKQSMISTVPELTVTNFPTLRAKNLPFVILFLNQSSPSSKEVKSTVTDIASKDLFTSSIFCWMDVQNETMGMQLLTEYAQDMVVPTLAVVDHKQAKVFVHPAGSVTFDQTIEWLTNVFNGKETPSKTLEERKWSPPGPYYDFLTMIDNEIEQEQEIERQGGDNLFSSGFKVGLEKEEEVREKLLERHTGGDADPDQYEGRGGQSLENAEQDKKDSSHDPAEL